ncbi:helix-turn-helix domain-containing protein [Planobispora takensis]|uniref:helix-turn-helix domain-containing protein n=1 Tax=Planobispora takensis TaxID=1367882 RepID=UPI00366A75E9
MRLQATERFTRGDSVTLIARKLRITARSVRRWRARWQQGGEHALRSAGPVCLERLSAQSWAALEAELKRGPLAHGFADDQYWTLGRIKTVIGRMFHLGYIVQGVAKLLETARLVGPGAAAPGRRA